MSDYIIAASKPWYKNIVIDILDLHSADGVVWKTNVDSDNCWYFVDTREALMSALQRCCPEKIFFPHWNWKVPEDIINAFECICFHETDLPFGRGGSPIQNLISRGYKNTKITVFRMTTEMDAGPIYRQYNLSLEGTAEEIYLRIAKEVSSILLGFTIGIPHGMHKQEAGLATYFKRRKPEESEITEIIEEEGTNTDIDRIEKLHDHIRMLDAPTYPKAFIKKGRFRYEFDSAILRMDGIHAHVRIFVDDERSESTPQQ